MRRGITGISIAAIVSMTAAPAAQTRPNFSGTWTQVRDDAPPPLNNRWVSVWGLEIVITYDASTLTIAYQGWDRSHSPVKLVFKLDGSPSGNPIRGAPGALARPDEWTATWEGEKLVLATVRTVSHPQMPKPLVGKVRNVLSLESPTVLLVERSATAGDVVESARTRYVRK